MNSKLLDPSVQTYRKTTNLVIFMCITRADNREIISRKTKLWLSMKIYVFLFILRDASGFWLLTLFVEYWFKTGAVYFNDLYRCFIQTNSVELNNREPLHQIASPQVALLVCKIYSFDFFTNIAVVLVSRSEQFFSHRNPFHFYGLHRKR